MTMAHAIAARSEESRASSSHRTIRQAQRETSGPWSVRISRGQTVCASSG
jgi:hypothetical protein